jgi:hypothetical protein
MLIGGFELYVKSKICCLLEHLQEFPTIFSQNHGVSQLAKNYWKKLIRSSPTIFNNSPLKYRRRFYIRVPILFLNYPNYFYIFSLLYICIRNHFLLVILSHALSPLNWLMDTCVVDAWIYPCDQSIFSSIERLRGGIRNCCRRRFFIFAKNPRLGGLLLRTLGDALRASFISFFFLITFLFLGHFLFFCNSFV